MKIFLAVALVAVFSAVFLWWKEPTQDARLTQEKARDLALSEAGKGSLDFRFSIVDEKTAVKPYGWIFYYVAEAVAMPGEVRRPIPGTGPIVVTKEGEVVMLGSSRPPATLIADFEVARGLAQ
jgi:hypothetical protein